MAWTRWLYTLVVPSRRAKGGRARRPLSLEVLESRDLLSAVTAHPTYVLLNSSGVTPLGGTGPNGYTPAQIRHAYGFDRLAFGSVAADGAGTTIAIIDAYDDPTIASDLHQFDLHFGLPDPVFTKVNQRGGATPPAANHTWAVEIALDVEWAHAIAPAANILLVEADDNNYSNLVAAIDYATSQPTVVAVSMSWGSVEFNAEVGFDSHFVTPAGHAGVTFIASSGDHGSPPEYPAVAPTVLAVGGTTLRLDAQGNVQSETGWSSSGGGISQDEPQPGFQVGVVTQTTTHRASPDVAYDADPTTGFSVYDTYDNSAAAPWSLTAGTSAGAPQWAALIAIADQGRELLGVGSLDGARQTLPMLYQLASANFHDITSGTSLGGPRFDAGPGYDLVTGLGSPHADLLVPALAGTTPAAAGSTLFQDDFSGAALNPAWSLHGGVWSQHDGVFSQTSTTAGDPKKALLDDRTYPGDVEVTARVRIDSWADGDLARAGIGLATDPLTGRGYNLVFHSRGGSRNNVEFLDDGVRWGNRYAFNWNLDTWYWFKLKDVDGVLYGKIWQDGAAEPTAWQFTQSGWSGRPGGAPALNGGAASAGGGSAAVSFDDVTVRSPAATATAPPTGLTAAAVSIDQVNLSWHASAGATGYRVERTVGGTTAWTPVAQLGAGTIAYADTGLLSGSAYSYRVVATGPAGDSNPSGVVTATTGTPTTLFHDDFSSPTLGAAWSLRGGAWGQFQSVFSQRSTASGDPKKAMLTNQAYPAALEVSARVRVDGWVDGDYARAGIGLSTDPVTGRGFNLVFRSSGGSRNHVAFLDDGVRWGQTHDFAWSLNTWYRFKLKAINGSLYGKVWADGSAEPVGWMFVQSGWSSRTGGAPSLNGGSALTGNGTATVSFDDVTVTGA